MYSMCSNEIHKFLGNEIRARSQDTLPLAENQINFVAHMGVSEIRGGIYLILGSIIRILLLRVLY